MLHLRDGEVGSRDRTVQIVDARNVTCIANGTPSAHCNVPLAITD
jgi:hypothetical protein